MLVIDVDALSKLAHWNILPLLPTLTGYAWSDTATVSSLVHRAYRALEVPDGRLFYSADAAKAAVSVIVQMRKLGVPSSYILEQLSQSNQIDAGEAVLLATIADDPNGRFLTGDKRALRALSTLDCANPFVGKVLLLEQIFSACMECKGRTWMLQNVCPFKNIDKAISIILGSECNASIHDISNGIDSYINELSALHNPSLLAH